MGEILLYNGNMSEKIKIGVSIDPECEQPQVLIKTAERTELIENIIKAVEQCARGGAPKITVYDGERIVFLDEEDIIRVYVENRMLTVCASQGKYTSRMTLKEFEENLDSEMFVRVSRFEIVNLKRVASFDLSVAGTIAITFEDGGETWVARRCVGNIREKLSAISKGGRNNE